MGRVGGGGASEEGDADSELKQSLHQKEAITAQMISIISTRLNSLQTVGALLFFKREHVPIELTTVNVLTLAANSRKLGLECDLRVNSDYCSKMVICIASQPLVIALKD